MSSMTSVIKFEIACQINSTHYILSSSANPNDFKTLFVCFLFLFIMSTFALNENGG